MTPGERRRPADVCTGHVLQRLADHIRGHPRLMVLTGAGVSAPSGIPTYRNDRGQWQQGDPIQHQDFVTEADQRRRYWARSMVGWRYVAASQPNAAHHALAALEAAGFVDLLVTQNVDRLHQRAGHRRVIDLHGRLDRVRCRQCGALFDRAAMQRWLESMNPNFDARASGARPDGDVDLATRLRGNIRVPGCRSCRGVLMPDVVFFGGSVPRQRVERVSAAVHRADALLIVGSSLMVYSAFRFCRLAAELGRPLIIVNRGRTRADDIATLKLRADCAELLPRLAARLVKSDRREVGPRPVPSPHP